MTNVWKDGGRVRKGGGGVRLEGIPGRPENRAPAHQQWPRIRQDSVLVNVKHE